MDWEPSPHAALTNGGYTSRPPLWAQDSYLSQEEGSADFGMHAKTDTSADWDNFGVGKQRMFGHRPGHEETGLERLLEDWGIGGDIPGSQAAGRGAKEDKAWFGWFRR